MPVAWNTFGGLDELSRTLKPTAGMNHLAPGRAALGEILCDWVGGSRWVGLVWESMILVHLCMKKPVASLNQTPKRHHGLRKGCRIRSLVGVVGATSVLNLDRPKQKGAETSRGGQRPDDDVVADNTKKDLCMPQKRDPMVPWYRP